MKQGLIWRADRWRSRFFTIWTGQAFSLIGSQLVQFALVWWLTSLTGSGAVLATATIAAVVPGIALGPVVGALVDRWDKRTVIVAADTLVAASALGLAFLFATGVVQVWHVYVAIAVRSVGQTFHWPAMGVGTTLMVPKEHYARVAGLSRSLQGTANFVCPVLGALLVGAMPMPAILGIDVATAFVAIAPLLFIRLPDMPFRRTKQTSVLADVREGVRFVFSWPGLLAILGIAMVVNGLGGAAFSLLPLLVTKTFGGQALHLGILEAAEGAAAIASGLAIAVWGGFKKRMRTAVIGMGLSGAGLLLLGLTPASMFAMAVACMFAVGVTSTITNASYSAALRASIPVDLQGRVGTLIGAAEEGFKPLFLLIAGFLADHAGARLWYAIDGGVALLLALVALCVPAIVGLEQRGAELARQRAATQPTAQTDAVGGS